MTDEETPLFLRHVRGSRCSLCLSDSGGEMYFCGARCLCVWAVLLATRPDLTDKSMSEKLSLLASTRERFDFKSIAELARWAVENAFGPKRF